MSRRYSTSFTATPPTLTGLSFLPGHLDTSGSHAQIQNLAQVTQLCKSTFRVQRAIKSSSRNTVDAFNDNDDTDGPTRPLLPKSGYLHHRSLYKEESVRCDDPRLMTRRSCSTSPMPLTRSLNPPNVVQQQQQQQQPYRFSMDDSRGDDLRGVPYATARLPTPTYSTNDMNSRCSLDNDAATGRRRAPCHYSPSSRPQRPLSLLHHDESSDDLTSDTQSFVAMSELELPNGGRISKRADELFSLGQIQTNIERQQQVQQQSKKSNWLNPQRLRQKPSSTNGGQVREYWAN